MKERTKQWLAAIICFLFLFTANKCASQNQRVVRANKHIAFAPTRPLVFNTVTKDTIYVSILADSISSLEYEYGLYASMSSKVSIQGFKIKIGFTDNTTFEFHQVRINNKHNWAEFSIDLELLAKMQSVKFDYLCFENDRISYRCANIGNGDYFIKFFSKL